MTDTTADTSAALSVLGSLLRLVAAVIFAGLLLLLYRDAVAPAFGYMGFVYQTPEPLWVMTALILVAGQSLLLPAQIRLPSDLFVWMFYTIVSVPALTMPLVSATQLNMALYSGMALALCFALLAFRLLPSVPLQISSRLALPPGLFWLLFCLLLAGFVAVLLFDFRAGLGRLLSLSAYSDIYTLRFSFREQSQSSFFLSAYFLLWSAKVMVPLLLALGLVRKWSWLVIGAIFLQVLMFSISGHKSFLLSLVLVIGLFWLLHHAHNGTGFILLVVLVTGLSAVLFYGLDNSTLVNVITRRALMVPGMLSGFYFEHFDQFGPAWFSHNFLSGWTESAYTKPPAFEIGQVYFGREETSSNVHFWADAFANTGFISVIWMSLLMAVLLSLINALWRSREPELVMALFIVPFWTLMESSLNTTLFSHGLLLALLLAILAPARSQSS